jgi:hypothetical protein
LADVLADAAERAAAVVADGSPPLPRAPAVTPMTTRPARASRTMLRLRRRLRGGR